MVSDGTGNDLDTSFTHPIPDSIAKGDISGEGTAAFIQTLSSAYHKRILIETPWRCLACHEKATGFVSRPFCFLSEGMIANRMVPVCQSDECEHVASVHLDDMGKHINGLLRSAGTSLSSVMSQRRACATCKKVMRMKECRQCRRISYCSRECQKKDWKRHKGECRSAVP